MKTAALICTLGLCVLSLSVGHAFAATDGEPGGSSVLGHPGKRERNRDSSDDVPKKKATGWLNPLLEEQQQIPSESPILDSIAPFCEQVEKIVGGGLSLKDLKIEKGTDLNQLCGDKMETALHMAARAGLADLALLLLSEGAAIDSQKDAKHMTPLHLAALNNHQTTIYALLSSGADAGAVDWAGTTPLEYAIRSGPAAAAPFVQQVPHSVRVFLENDADFAHIETLLKAGFDVNSQNFYGETILHVLASQEDTCSAIELLMDNGADINAVDGQGQTPLYHAMRNEQSAALECLLRFNPQVDIHDINGLPPLLSAVDYYLLQLAEGSIAENIIQNMGILVAHGAQLIELRELDASASAILLQQAVDADEQNLAKFLLDEGAAFDSRLADSAVRHPDLAILEKAFAEEDDRNSLLYCDALQSAVKVCNLGALGYLLERTPETTPKDCALVPYAVIACPVRDVSIALHLILEHGFDVDAQDADLGKTGLLWAASMYQRSPALVEFLLENGADPNRKNRPGDLALVQVAGRAGDSDEKDLQILKVLLKHRADLNAKGLGGDTALMSALEHNRQANIVWYLLREGADPSIVNDSNQSPENMFSGRIRQIATLFKRKSARLRSSPQDA